MCERRRGGCTVCVCACVCVCVCLCVFVASERFTGGSSVLTLSEKRQNVECGRYKVIRDQDRVSVR